ncbi:MAG: 50S ribosomal protein L25 [Melioribacteraceae bacterium]|nr:50S ribosomal protein L25 [Melioribacteraceae bacterium]
MAEKILKAKKREISTKGTMNQLRRDGFVPGIYYAKGKDQIAFSVEEIALNKYVFTSKTNILQLTFDGEEGIGCIIKDVQFDPVTDKVVHFDVLGVTLGQLLQLEVPVRFVGTSIGVKEGGILQEQFHRLEVECFPRHIPEHLEIDITELNIGDSISIRDLKFENITFLQSADANVVSVVAPRIEEEEVETDEIDSDEPVQPEVISKGKTEEDE